MDYEPTLSHVNHGIEHVTYEIDMLHFCADELLNNSNLTGRLHYAVLESFIVHWRALVGFLFDQKSEATDVIAEDFVVNPGNWYRDRGPITQDIVSTRKRASTEVAHITLLRKSGDDILKTWDIEAMLNTLKPYLKTFAEQLQVAASVKGAVPASFPSPTLSAPRGATGIAGPLAAVIDLTKRG